MTKRKSTLPDFERPPLNEMLLSIQFASLPFQNYHSGLLWKRFSEHYPMVEEQPPLEPVFETFGTVPKPQEMSLQLLTLPDPLRYWFITEDKTELLQVQRDRVIHNWRRQTPEDEYPRFEALRSRFENDLVTVAKFLKEEKLGDIECNQCEVSYINVIREFEKDIDPASQLPEIFTFWTNQYSDDYSGKLESGQFNITYEISSEVGKEPAGRLHIAAQRAILREENKPAIRLSLTARGKPRSESIKDAFAWLEMGREVVVRSFTSITSTEMHRLWGRKS